MSSSMTFGVMVGVDVITLFCTDGSDGKQAGNGCFSLGLGCSSSMMWTGAIMLVCAGTSGLIFVDWILLRLAWRWPIGVARGCGANLRNCLVVKTGKVVRKPADMALARVDNVGEKRLAV